MQRQRVLSKHVAGYRPSIIDVSESSESSRDDAREMGVSCKVGGDTVNFEGERETTPPITARYTLQEKESRVRKSDNTKPAQATANSDGVYCLAV